MRHLAKRLLVCVLILAMLLSTMSGMALAAEPTAAPADAAGNVHVLEASALTAFAAGDKKDGDTETVGDYFTLIYSAKTKVDSSKKEWEDGYASEQRINFGGKATTEKNAVKFTTNAPATVKIWWAQGGDDNREYAILDSAGEVVVKTSGTYEKNKPYLSTLELTEAGTYFLGGETNNNYLFKVEVEETPATEKVSVLEASALTAFAAGDKADGDSEVVGDYFNLLYSAKTKVDGSKKTWEDGYASEQRINFGGKATTEKNAVKFTTTGPATVKIWWAQGGDDNREYAILNTSGEVVAKTSGTYEKNQPYLSTLELAEAGTYFLGGETNNNYLFKVEVTEISGARAPRADWSKSAAPSITAVAVNPENANEVLVTVSGEVGYDAADQVTVVMRDADGWQLESHNSLAEKSEHELAFTPDASGTYTFEVLAAREGEAAHKGAETKSFTFSLPLTGPVLKYAVNDGKGGITVEWNAVLEAEKYRVTVGEKTVDVEGTRTLVEGFTVGDTLDVNVQALRADEVGPDAAEKLSVTVADKPDTPWVFSAFGTSVKLENNGYEKKDDGIRVYSINGSGKVQPAAEDGVAFYYTMIDPKTTNFVLSATANVNTWKYSNGQDGFGLLAMDQVGVSGSNAPVFSNSFMAAVSGFNYNAEDGTKINMRLGVGSLQRSGVTEYSDSQPDSYSGTWTPLDFSGVGTEIRNLVGNCENADAVPGKTIEPALTSFQLKIEKTDEGYFVSYTDQNGETHTAEYTDPAALSYVDDFVYVGMFAARNADVTFTDIEFTTSAASGSTTSTETETPAPVAGSVTFMNPTVSSGKNVSLDVRTNADGSLIVTDAAGKELYKGVVKADVKTLVAAELAEGENKYTATFTPDAEFVTADGAKLESYDAITAENSVTYKADSRTVIYVAPNGKADAAGTKEDPTTLAEAVKCPAPGTTILLMEGTYELESGIDIERGINGTKDAPITLKADPNASTRPVLDFLEKGNGLRLKADYWHLYGFDSTHSTAKGVHVGGNNNVVERVNVYENLNTGLSISRISFGDSIPDWPSNNTIKNCSAWLNADPGFEDADGFEAKLTVGEGNVFDGCIAAYNADDGWDLYARGGLIGAVTIQNSISFKNGWVIEDGQEVNAGNGNGFKLGGSNYAVDHKIINSIAFANKANGITCNSNPNLKVENCTAYGNGSGNLSLYTKIASIDTAFEVKGFISYLGTSNDSIAAQNAQVKENYINSTSYYQGNTSGEKVAEDWFKSLDVNTAIASGISRNTDGSISMNGLLELTDKAPKDAGARLPGAQGKNFRDVSDTTWYAKAVETLAGKKLISGMPDGTFGPALDCTRSQAAMMLYNMAEKPAVEGESTLTDVAAKAYYADAAAWAVANGYMKAEEDAFAPNDAITCEELVNALALIAKTESDPMTWAAEEGILVEAAGLAAADALTRADAAAMIAAYLAD